MDKAKKTVLVIIAVLLAPYVVIWGLLWIFLFRNIVVLFNPLYLGALIVFAVCVYLLRKDAKGTAQIPPDKFYLNRFFIYGAIFTGLIAILLIVALYIFTQSHPFQGGAWG